jgi:hypothetical protein
MNSANPQGSTCLATGDLQGDENEAAPPAMRSNYRGVEWDVQLRKWRSRITILGKKISLGSFVDDRDAAM